MSILKSKNELLERELQILLQAFLENCQLYKLNEINKIIKNIIDNIKVENNQIMHITFPQNVITTLRLRKTYTMKCMPGAPTATLWAQLPVK